MAAPYPVPNATIPFWRTELHELDSYRSTTELPKKQDIVIIGAGFAGAALARYLLEDNPSKPSVTILEAREACSGASGRNGGQLRPDLFAGVAARMQARGLETANEVATFEAANARAIVTLVESEQIACDLRPVTTADAYDGVEEAARVKKLWDVMTKLLPADSPTRQNVVFHGPSSTSSSLSDNAGNVEDAIGVKDTKVAFTYLSHVLWPYKLVMHILARAVALGANLQTHTAVSAISETPDAEGYWTVATASSRGSIKARKVLFATNAYTAGLLPEYDDAIYAARGTVCRASSSSEERKVKLGSCDVRSVTHDAYYGTRADGSLVIGGAKSTYRGDKGLWYRNYDDATLIEAAVPFFRGWPGKALVGWKGEGEDGKGEGEGTVLGNVWTGIMGYSADTVPHVGPVPSKLGLYICAGFNGHGMPNVLLSAKGLAAMVRDGCAFSETGVPACYETSAERLRKIAESVAGKTTGRARADVYLKY